MQANHQPTPHVGDVVRFRPAGARHEAIGQVKRKPDTAGLVRVDVLRITGTPGTFTRHTAHVDTLTLVRCVAGTDTAVAS